MNKKRGLSFVLTLSVMFCFSQTNYYVATTGNDSNSGTDASPFKTIAKAINSFDSNLGGTCFIKGGTYHESIIVDGKNNITITNYNTDAVILDGTVAITSGWTLDSGNIYVTDVTQDIWQLFIDDEQQVMARWPNAQFTDNSIYDHFNWAKGTNGGTTNTHIQVDFTNGHPDLAATGINAQGAMVIANVGNWKTWARTVTNHSTGQNEFDYTQADSFVNVKNYFYLECKKELIDTNNEWYYDLVAKKLYVFGNPTGKTIKGKTQSYAFTVTNSSNITIDGLHFFGTTVKFDNSTNGKVDHCNFAFPSCSKRMLKLEAPPETTEFLSSNVSTIRNYLIKNCLFEHIDGEAIYLEGKNNTIENCYFQYVDYSCGSTRYGQNTIVNTGENFTVTKCTLHTLGASQGIASRKMGADFSYNDISNTGLVQSDGATMGAGQNKGDGTRIHHNWVHDTRKNGIRFDAPFGSSALGGQNGFVDHNVVWNCGAGIKMKGDINHIYNNTVFNNDGVDISILNESMVDPNDSNNTLYSNQNTVTRNNLAGQISGHRSNPVNSGGMNVIPGIIGANVHSETATPFDVTALLEDPNNNNFRPKASSSSLINNGIVDDTSGLNPEITTGSISLPDVGAYELGGDNWVPGVTWTPDFFPWSFLTLSVSENIKPINKLQLYPVPTKELLFFKLKKHIPIKEVIVFNLLGQKVIESVGKSDYLNIKTLSRGIYVFKLRTEDELIFSEKFIVK